MVIKNKKSQIPTTLTWFAAFIIIFFIILLFITASIIIAGKKGYSTIDVNVGNSNFGNLESQRSLIGFLETPVKIDNKNEKIKDLILESIDPYIESNIDLGKLSNTRQNFGEEFFIAHQAELKDEILFNKSKEILSVSCSEYMLRLPQGVIFSGKTDFASDDDFETLAWEEILISKWTPWAEIQLPYKGQMIKIKFRELKKC